MNENTQTLPVPASESRTGTLATVLIFDTTLRDGEQCPGAAMTEDQKLDVAHRLEAMGVDIIEAGFPVSSPVQFEAVRRITHELERPVIAGLARAVRGDIEAAARALTDARRKRIHTFIASSPIHMKFKLGKNPTEVIAMAVEAVKFARGLCEDVEFSPEDATRSEWEFLAELVGRVTEAGATTINVPDTVGYTTPEEYGALFAYLIKNTTNANKIVFSAHCHNDLGLATSNSLAAAVNGARQIECTINGIGERAGNTAMEEIVMAIQTRQEHYRLRTNIDSTKIYRASMLVRSVTGMAVQPNKAIVGDNAFAHESGIHQDGVLKNALTYEIMTPQSIGLDSNRMVLGRHSGRHGFKDRLTLLGHKPEEAELDALYARFLELADKKKEVYDEDVLSLLDEGRLNGPARFELAYLHVSSGISAIPTATVKVRDTRQDATRTEAACGDGPVDAIYNAIERATGISSELQRFRLMPLTAGRDAQARATVVLKIGAKTVNGSGTSTDILEAATLAFLDALNRASEGEPVATATDGDLRGV